MTPPNEEPLVLLLNASYEPLRVISWQTAITFLYLNKVEVIEQYESTVASPSREFPLPSVVRLYRYTARRRRVEFSRHNVYRRDEYTCQYCGVRHAPARLSLDHVVPRAHGGRTEWTNIVTACVECNAIKAARTPEQARMGLRSRPAVPVSLPVMDPARAPDPRWAQYLG